jgi:glucose-6-phosphate dehydrogenase assembly protein OpcA
MEDFMNEPAGAAGLHSGVAVDFADIESALKRQSSDESPRSSSAALTATLVVAGPSARLTEAAAALGQLTHAGVRAVLISYGDNAAPPVHVSRHTVSLDGLRPEYLNNAVGALRLSSLPTLVWWRGGRIEALTGLAALSDRLVLDAEDPGEVWALVGQLAERTAVSDLRWTRLTRWRALMAHFFDIAEVCNTASTFRTLRIEGSDPHAARLYAGWLASTLHWSADIRPDIREVPNGPPITAILLGDGSQELTLRLAENRTCVATAARVNGLAPTSRTVSMGNQDLAALVGEELRIRARDLAFERAVTASRGFA